MKLQLLTPQPCIDPAQDLRNESGSFIWVDGNKVRLIISKEGHSIASIREIAEVPGVLPGSAFGGGARGGTLTKISNSDLSAEFDMAGRQQQPRQ